VVRRPLAADYPSEPVTAATEPCPACGALDFEECTPTEQWRGGRVEPDGTTSPTPIVVCRVCGHAEPEGAFYAPPWAAVRRHSDLTITVAGRDVDASALTIEPVADPAARLLGPQPPDPDAG
jgi:hypothetical protein